jgi:outer membrane protein OmpA-like peptidoglycan-associated protein
MFAVAAVLLLRGSALAQSVSVFDDAPSIEQLRRILVPESRPGTSRSIVIQRPDIDPSSSSTQRASTQVKPPSRPPGVIASPSSPVEQAANSPKQDPADQPGAVAFHVNFAFDSAELPDSAHEMIDLIAQLMRESPQVKLRVEGHTDASGSSSYNVVLSERRALSVGQYLVKQGVNPSRLMLVGKGMAEPLTRNKYDPANRRVQFVRIG